MYFLPSIACGATPSDTPANRQLIVPELRNLRSECASTMALQAQPLCCITGNTISRGNRRGRQIMNLEKFTDRAKGFLQSAQTVAIRMNHQRIAPEHLLKALLEDEQGMAAGLIARGGRQRRGGAARDRRGAGQDSGGLGQRRQPDARPRRRARSACSTRPSRSRRRPATAMSRSSGCCSRSCSPARPTPARRSPTPGVEGRGAQRRDQRAARRPHRRHRRRRGPLRRAEEVRPRPDRRRRATASSIR